MALSQSLNVELNSLAKSLQRFGRGKDSMLAHITPQEAQILKARGGRGSANPVTGLLEFDDTPLPETVNVTTPAAAPNIDVAPAPQAPEQVTVSANKQQQPVSAPTDFAFPMATAPQVAQSAPVQAPTAPAAPEQVTVSAPAVQPQNFGAFQAPFIPQPQAPAPEQPQQDQSWLERNKTLLEALGIGGLGLYGGMNSARAAGQAQQLQTNLSNLAAPLSAAGNADLAGVQSGALNPANERALEAARAQTSQAQTAGAVSSQQAAEAISGTFSTLLNNQLNQALALLNSADGYLQQAYINGYNANSANQTNTQNFYANLAQLATRLAGGTA